MDFQQAEHDAVLKRLFTAQVCHEIKQITGWNLIE
jgi:hypothetical protein